jgi:CheY-like chemotaxis protein
LTAPSPGGHILIVEDDEAVRCTIAELLEDAGYLVECAVNGKEALGHLHRGPLPFLILLDLLMPVMDGYEFYGQLQANPAWAAIPVVVVSAVAEDLPADSPLGATPRLQKPFPTKQLLEIVAYCASPVADRGG